MAARLRSPGSRVPDGRGRLPGQSDQAERLGGRAVEARAAAQRGGVAERAGEREHRVDRVPMGMYPTCRPPRADHPAERATVPEVGGHSPDIESSSVALPDPLPPMIATSSP